MKISTEEVRTYFNDVAGYWDCVNHCDHTKLRRIVEIAQIHQGDFVLDLACGTGVLTEFLLNKTSYVMGLDLAKEMIERAREKFRATTVSFLCGDFYAYTGERFDVIVLHNAYPHFPDKYRLVTCLANALKPQGRVVVAHSMGRERVNQVHRGRPCHLSEKLLPVDQEAILFQKAFDIDFKADEREFYAFSGKKRDD